MEVDHEQCEADDSDESCSQVGPVRNRDEFRRSRATESSRRVTSSRQRSSAEFPLPFNSKSSATQVPPVGAILDTVARGLGDSAGKISSPGKINSLSMKRDAD
jgi:hypothetical protein